MQMINYSWESPFGICIFISYAIYTIENTEKLGRVEKLMIFQKSNSTSCRQTSVSKYLHNGNRVKVLTIV